MSVRMVEVWNDGNKEYQEMFRGNLVTIPAKDKIVMEDPDASQFLGQFTPIRRDAQGNNLTSKPLRKVYITEATQAELKCMMCGKNDAKTQADLDAHIAEMHQASMIDEEAKKELNKKSKFFR